MFKSTAANSPDLVAVAKETATHFARADRDRFLPALRAVEEYARKRGLVAAGACASYMLAGGHAAGGARPLDLYQYEFFSTAPVEDARAISDAVFKTAPCGVAQYTVSLPRAGGAGAVVRCEQRDLVRLKRPPKYRGVETFAMLGTVARPALFSAVSLRCLGPGLQLLEIYVQLCDPRRAGDWPALLGLERTVRGLFLAAGGITGGRVRRHRTGKDRADHRPSPGGRAERAKFRTVALEFAAGEGRLVVDKAPLAGEKAPARRAEGRLAVVTSKSLADEEAALKSAAREAGANILVVINNPFLVADVRLRRLTVYVLEAGKTRTPVLDVYNAGTYEAVPYLVDGDGAKHGTAFVSARFLLVDIWTLQLLARMGSVSGEFERQQQEVHRRELAALAPRLADGAAAFPARPDHFVGVIVDADNQEKRDADVAYKKARADQKAGQKKGAFPRYPARYAEACSA
jgi:hypothetical protein